MREAQSELELWQSQMEGCSTDSQHAILAVYRGFARTLTLLEGQAREAVARAEAAAAAAAEAAGAAGEEGAAEGAEGAARSKEEEEAEAAGVAAEAAEARLERWYQQLRAFSRRYQEPSAAPGVALPLRKLLQGQAAAGAEEGKGEGLAVPERMQETVTSLLHLELMDLMQSD